MDVVLYPDPILRKKAQPVARFDAELRATADAMHAAMAKAKGVGLAAPQVGLPLALLVLNASGDRAGAITLVNPKISRKTGEAIGEEGCLSFPSIYAEIARAESLVVEAQDVEGKPIRLELADFVARIVQHEFDHLDGVLFIDRMSPADRVRVKSQLKALEDRYRADQAERAKSAAPAR